MIRWAHSVASSARMALLRGPGRKVQVQGLSIMARSSWRPNARFVVADGRYRISSGHRKFRAAPRGLLLRTVLLITLTPLEERLREFLVELARKADPSATEAVTLIYTKLG